MSEIDPLKKPLLAVSIVAGIGGVIVGFVLATKIAIAPKIGTDQICVVVGVLIAFFSCGIITRYPGVRTVLQTILGAILLFVLLGLLTNLRMHYWP